MKIPEISNKVIKKIKEKRIKMRSRFSIVAEKLGLESAAIFLLLLGVFLFGLIGYLLVQSGATEFLGFGPPGFLILIHNFPYDLLIITIIIIFLAALILKRFDFSYKKNFKLIITLIITGVIIFGIALSAFNIHEKIHQRVVNKNIPLVSPFFRQRAGYHLKGLNAHIGEIKEIKDEKLILETPDKQKITITYTKETKMPSKELLKLNQRIAVIGKLKNGEMEAKAIRIFRGQYWQLKEKSLRPHRLFRLRFLK